MTEELVAQRKKLNQQKREILAYSRAIIDGLKIGDIMADDMENSTEVKINAEKSMKFMMERIGLACNTVADMKGLNSEIAAAEWIIDLIEVIDDSCNKMELDMKESGNRVSS